MTDTAYTMISTNDLINRWISYGLFSSLVVYGEHGADEIKSIEAMKKKPVIIGTAHDTYEIPVSDKDIKMWRILA